MSDLIKINEKISYLPSSRNPLSCEVIFIKEKDATWIFDVGLSKDAADKINSIQGKKNIVISHFHPDHTFNLLKIKYDNLYVSKYTKRYTFKGTVIQENTNFPNGMQIWTLPSSHAKGCLCLLAGDYAFMGDGTYSKERRGNHTYNIQLLKEEIEVLKKIPCTYVCLDHDPTFIQKRVDLIELHQQIYNRKNDSNFLLKNNCEISVEDFFHTDGTVRYEDRDK